VTHPQLGESIRSWPLDGHGNLDCEMGNLFPRWGSDPSSMYLASCTTYHVLSRGTGGRWSDRAKAAYKSRRDYIIAVKGKMRQRVTERVGGVSANLVDFVEWRLLVWLTVSRVHSARLGDVRRHYPMFSDVRRYSAILSELQFTIVTPCHGATSTSK